MDLEPFLFTNLGAIAAAMLLLWLVSLLKRDASIVDIFWGCGFVIIAWLSILLSQDLSGRALLLAGMVSVWGIRLSVYLAWRNLGHAEDHRYAAMRQRHGKRFGIVSLVTVFALQGAVMWIVALPIQVGIFKSLSWHTLALVGVTFWLIGLFFEAVGDYQLFRFKANPANRGRVMDRGLWKYTRHPNYFGDFLVWWGFYFVSFDPTTWWWTIISPLLMSFLLIRVSGVRLLEDSLRSRVAGYEEYVARTSAFFPLPPKVRVQAE